VSLSLSLSLSSGLVKGCLVASVAIAASVLAYATATRETFLSRLAAGYVRYLDGNLKVLFQPEIGRRIALGQGLAAGAVVGAHLVTPVPYWWLAVAVILCAPALYLRQERQQRVARLEAQVDGFVVALANSLKTVPSPAAALQATASVLQQPTRQEIEYVLKEMRVGSTLEQALVAMSARVKSRWLDVAFSAVLIGLRVGGNLPVVLERTASTIREMNRLLGVVRTKTGEGRMQLWVLALFPLLIVFGFNAAQKGYFDPLQDSLIGQLAVGVASLLWIGSLLLARKVLAVDV
jgi:tight adherence protein B